MNEAGTGQKPLAQEMDFTVRMYDIDFNGHVSNIAYIRWLEDLRMVGFEQIASMEDCLKAGQVPVLLSTTIDYKWPIYMFEKPKGMLWISGFTRTTFKIEAEICVDGRICAKATQTCVFINKKTNRATRLPEAVLSKLKQVLPESVERKPLPACK
jgi:acyl-CoA thioester hydrolase